MPWPGAGPPGLLALVAPRLPLLALLLAQLSGRPAHAGPARTLVLLDVSARAPLRLTSPHFLSLQLDPSILHDGWLDFLR